MATMSKDDVDERELRLRNDIRRCQTLLDILITLATGERIETVWKRYTAYIDFVHKTIIERDLKDRFIEEARAHTFQAYRTKLDLLLELSLGYARQGDVTRKDMALKEALLCLSQARSLTKDNEFLAAVELRIALARETSQPGDSEKAKNQPDDGWAVAARKHEKRRFIRYVTPTFLVRVGRDPLQYRTTDYSIAGFQLAGLPTAIRVGQKVVIEMLMEKDADLIRYKGFATVARILSVDGPVGFHCSNASGPIMYFIQKRRLDLAKMDPL